MGRTNRRSKGNPVDLLMAEIFLKNCSADHVRRQIVRQGLDVNARDDLGLFTSFLFTAGCSKNKSRAKIMEYLLSAGADATLRNRDGDTALMVCAHHACRGTTKS